ncbi:MAG TPA: endonuclease V [Vicinamibacteria bacterium]|nr:endonuclease V [Vicinamibacteria bacterium]
MKIPRVPHPWTVSPKAAVEIQLELGSRVRRVAPESHPRFVVGVDGAFTDDRAIGAAVCFDTKTRRVVEESIASRTLVFPYVPGLLSFREAPVILRALRKLRLPVNAILCDGHGLAHPRRFGLACHVGVLWDGPTIGCAKNLLLGTHRPVGFRRGCSTPLRDKGEIVGSVLRTRDGVRPVFVSIGHKVDRKTAEKVVLACTVGYRLPEPIRRAHQIVSAAV